jgi:hypothetical protein
MKEIQRKAIIIALITLIAVVFGFNSVFADKTDRKGLLKDLREEIKNYSEKNIFPEIQEWKSILDKSMSKEDLAKLNDLRAKSVVMKNEMKEEKKSIIQESKEEDWDKDDFKDKMKDESEEFKSEMKTIARELKPLAEKYRYILAKIGEKAKPKKEEWENGILQIVNNWKNNHKEEIEKLKNNKKIEKNLLEKATGFNKLNFDGDKKKAVARFMLWDGKQPMHELNENHPGSEKMLSEIKEALRSYPNPFNEKTTIYFNLSKSDLVNLSVFDESGNKITVLFEGELGNGEHSFVFNTKNYKNLSAGTYTYKLTTSNGTKSGRMVLAK